MFLALDLSGSNKNRITNNHLRRNVFTKIDIASHCSLINQSILVGLNSILVFVLQLLFSLVLLFSKV